MASAIFTGSVDQPGRLRRTDDQRQRSLAEAFTNFTVTSRKRATQLVITSPPPAAVTVGAPFSLTVTAEDSLGNITPGFFGTVSLALANNPGKLLGGTLTATFSKGVATFTGLSLSAIGSGYTLNATASGLTIGTTPAFTVTATGIATQADRHRAANRLCPCRKPFTARRQG